MVPPGRLPIGSNYHLFKDGIEPEWEHKDNHQVNLRRQSHRIASHRIGPYHHRSL
jgi:hypothetical protein